MKLGRLFEDICDLLEDTWKITLLFFIGSLFITAMLLGIMWLSYDISGMDYLNSFIGWSIITTVLYFILLFIFMPLYLLASYPNDYFN